MKYRVAEFEIDTARYRISVGGEPLPVEPKVFDLLVYLIRHRERVLSRDELFREVWDGREVSDATLGNHVKSARRLLGDDGERQQLIQTVRGRGYQFVAPVEELPEPTPTSAPAPPAPTPSTPDAAAPRRRWALGLSALLLAALALLAARWGLAPGRSAGTEPPYVLVLPLDVPGDAPADWGPQADQATRELIRNLRKISGLRVVPAPSAFTFKGRKTREHIRAQLPELRYVLDGSLLGADGQQLRLAVELEDLRSGRVIWERDYAGGAGDTGSFATLSAIAAAVSNALKVAILADERRALAELPTANLQAYERYVAGRHELDLVKHESLRRAIALFNEAIALDPDFFDAYVARSDAYRQLFAYFEPPASLLQAVVDSLSEAQALRPDSAEVWSSLGLSYVMAWRWKDAWTALNAARRRDPGLAQTELGFALYYAGLGEAAKVKQALATAERLDPLNAEMADWGNWALFMAGERQAARAWAERKMRQHPDVGVIFSGAGIGASITGDHVRAVPLAERGAELDGSAVSLVMLAQVYGYAGQPDRVRPLLQRAQEVGGFVCPYESAAAWLSLGEQELALAALEDAAVKRSNCLIFLRQDPRMKPLHADPRFAALLSRVGLDDTALPTYPR